MYADSHPKIRNKSPKQIDNIEYQHLKMQSHLLPLYHSPFMPYYPPPMHYPYMLPQYPPLQPAISTRSIKIENIEDPISDNDEKSAHVNLMGYGQNYAQPHYPPYPLPGYGYAQSIPQFNYSKNYFYQPIDNIQENDFIRKENKKQDNQNLKLGPKKNYFKNKTADQIINEFKSFTLPKLRLKRLIKMQAIMRSWHVRKFVIPRKKIMNKMLKLISEKMIENFIEVRS